MNRKNNETVAQPTGAQLSLKLQNLRLSLDSLGAAKRLACRVQIEGVERQIRNLAAPVQS